MTNNLVRLIVTWVLLGTCPAFAQQTSIAAIVNDEVITTGDVAERRALLMATAEIPDTVENQEKITPRILHSLVDEALELQEAKRQSITVTDEEISKSIAEMSASQENKDGDLKGFIAARGLSLRSLENQVRAQIAWSKVVQRKLRRNVSISQDEIRRAQMAQAAAPGTTQLRITALTIPIASAEKEAAAASLSDKLVIELKSGNDMPAIAAQYMGSGDVQLNPPVWVDENDLQPAMQQALRGMKQGETTPALRSQNSIQIIQLLDRQLVKPQADSTEIALKQIEITVPPKRDKSVVAKIRSTTLALKTNPGTCEDATLPATDLPANATFVRAKMGALNPQQRGIISRLAIGGVSEPLLSPEKVRLVMLCEKIEPSVGNLADAETVRQKLFSEKIELEAQKHLRDLRRDAFIDVKGAP